MSYELGHDVSQAVSRAVSQAVSPALSSAANPAAPLRCALHGAAQARPALQVLAVDCSDAAGQGDAAQRALARQRVRAVLLQHAGPDIASPLLAAPRMAAGGGQVSISHGAGLSLVAWGINLQIGVDLVDLAQLGDALPQTLADTAALYLGRKVAKRLHREGTTPALWRRRFAQAWARYEASLKCLGLTLDEWTPAMQARLSGCATAVLALPVGLPGDSARWVAAVAWRADSATGAQAPPVPTPGLGH